MVSILLFILLLLRNEGIGKKKFKISGSDTSAFMKSVINFFSSNFKLRTALSIRVHDISLRFAFTNLVKFEGDHFTVTLT